MPTLGDRFSEGQKREYIKNNLSPGNVYYLYCSFTNPNKNKYLLLVCTKHELLFLVINSAISRFISIRPELYRCQVGIDAEQHKFLDHDSFIDCTTSIRIEHSDIEKQLLSDLSRLKGRITQQVQEKMLSAVRASTTISRRDKELILTSFS